MTVEEGIAAMAAHENDPDVRGAEVEWVGFYYEGARMEAMFLYGTRVLQPWWRQSPLVTMS